MPKATIVAFFDHYCDLFSSVSYNIEDIDNLHGFPYFLLCVYCYSNAPLYEYQYVLVSF